MYPERRKNRCLTAAFLALLLILGLGGTAAASGEELLLTIPAYSGSTYCEVNDNIPEFDPADLTTDSFESYSELDRLGRCGVAYANVGTDLMPTEKRGDISSIHPTGWVQNTYDIVESGSLYNRCHLLAYELTGENANERNLITGTRYFNAEGMLPFENMITDYIKETGMHVLYRVTPIFEGDNLLANGVQMEAQSVEDEGEGIRFNVFCYNVQPGITIDYATGDNWLSDAEDAMDSANEEEEDSYGSYVLNTSSKKFHDPSCPGVNDIKEKNKEDYTGSRKELIEKGYEPCKSCNP